MNLHISTIVLIFFIASGVVCECKDMGDKDNSFDFESSSVVSCNCKNNNTTDGYCNVFENNHNDSNREKLDSDWVNLLEIDSPPEGLPDNVLM